MEGLIFVLDLVKELLVYSGTKPGGRAGFCGRSCLAVVVLQTWIVPRGKVELYGQSC